MGRYFGTDGFRGEVNKVLTVEDAYKIGRYLGWYYGKNPKEPGKCRVVIGKDPRRSSYMLEDALCAGLNTSGADVYLLHVTTTPSVSYMVRADDFDCGIMISASHNPYYDNGIKVINGNGEKLEEDVIAGIEDYIDNPTELPRATRDDIGQAISYDAGRNRYIGYLISLATHSFKGKKIALDCANGSSSMIAKSVFDALGAQTHVIHADPDGTNINRDCGSTHIEKLCWYVQEHNCDVGFAFDGDADRCIAVDEHGEVVDGDKILYICGKYMKEKGDLYNTTVVTTIMSNLGLYKALDKEGINYEKTAVGDKYVYENMQQNGNCLGGEQSGHVIFSKHATTGDGIVTAIKVMEVVMSKKLPLSKLAEGMKKYPQVLKNVPVTDKDAVINNDAVKEAVSKVEKRLGDDGRILLRPSGTEPVIRVMVEADTEDTCKECVNDVIDVMKKQGLVEK